ncbi:MAG: hypothetical protein ACLQBD_26990 [Syntrophobacteraceae bacterium]
MSIPYNSVEYLSGPEQMRLAYELAKVPRPHPIGQGSLSPEFFIRMLLENIQLVH